jgi:predicted dinucleotide-binding enzyme
MKVGFIGAGLIGSAVASALAQAGHEVIMSNSRGPQTLDDVVAQIGSGARAATAAEAAAESDVVMVAIPLFAREAVKSLPLDGKIVVDLMNYYPSRDGQIPELDSGATTTSEITASLLPGAKVVKAFNAIRSGDIAGKGRPVGDPERGVLLYAGDDAEAKRVVAGLISDTGFDPYDVGSLHEGFRFQNGAPAYGMRGKASDLEPLLAAA